MKDIREHTRKLSEESLRNNEPFAWFEKLYQHAQNGEAIVPWDDHSENKLLRDWLENKANGRLFDRALDVGCGLGDNAEFLSRHAKHVTAIDIAPTAIALAQKRFPNSTVHYCTASVTEPLSQFAPFDLIHETYTLQAIPEKERLQAIPVLRNALALNGILIVIARARLESEPVGPLPPWPLSEAEIRAIQTPDIALISFEEMFEGEPLVRRFRAIFQRICVSKSLS